jgi:hypothetical protein
MRAVPDSDQLSASYTDFCSRNLTKIMLASTSRLCRSTARHLRGDLPTGSSISREPDAVTDQFIGNDVIDWKP